jgi:outer membrane protein OmpA-like peptidoglycan-associated protein
MGAKAPGAGFAKSFISISTNPISSRSLPTSLRRNAQNLTGIRTLKLKLEGNTDERGTREYNIGLGERRAQAVRRALMLQGVAETQLTTTSFGAERPRGRGRR